MTSDQCDKYMEQCSELTIRVSNGVWFVEAYANSTCDWFHKHGATGNSRMDAMANYVKKYDSKYFHASPDVMLNKAVG